MGQYQTATKEIYLIISYQRDQKENPEEIIFLETDINAKNIYINELKGENGSYFYKRVFKLNKEINNTYVENDINYNLEFEIENDKYIASFDINEKTFVYDLELKKETNNLNNKEKQNIDQHNIDYYNKFLIFLEALKDNNEEGKIEMLCKETIDLYSQKKNFSVLIPLFIQIYKMNELCTSLMEKFKEANINIKENENNMDINKDLEKYKSFFTLISLEADNIIKNNGYDPIQFYSIILCYLNYYDYGTFLKMFNILYIQNKNILYEILLIYFSHFLNPINQDLDFFTKFISYTVSKKEFDIFAKD